MKPSIDQLLAKIESGVALEEITASFVAPERLKLLRRSAAARVFDQAIFEQILAPDPNGEMPAISIEQLLEKGDIEAVPNAPGNYRIPFAARARHLRDWRMADSAQPILQLSSALAAYLEKERPEDRLELLYQLAISDPGRAARLFESMYAEADAAFDLARCTDLVGVLEQRDREGLLRDPRLGDLRADFRTYLGARTLHATDFYQTAQYLEREGLTRIFEQLLKNPNRWILQLHAPGGMGKSIFERWLVAFRCIPTPYRIPCARVDFDVTSPFAAREPWLLLHEIAADLDQQISGNRFAKVLDLLAPYRVWMRQRPDANSAPVDPRVVGSLREMVPTQFVEVLNDLPGSKPVVVIFDTLEELLLRQETPELLLRLMGWIQAQSQQRLRLILAGRYELSERMIIAPEFARAMKTILVEPFSDREAARYLSEKRRIEPKEATRVVIEKALGNPFKLALYADLLRAEPGMTAEAIRAYPDADIAYLIQRIIVRVVPPQVRWVLRYGAIPRHLTRRFLEEVMAEPMAEAMSGINHDDDPRNDPIEEKLRRTLFPTDELVAGGTLDLDQLWRQLGEYAAQFAWVSVPPGEVDTLIFHSDVFVPMRALLRKYQPRIFERLHRLGFAHFQRRAEAESNQWGRWTGEALYHAEFASGGFAAFCQHVLDEARRRRDVQTRFDLGMQIAGFDTLPKPVRREAQWSVAIAGAELARRSGDVKLWQCAETALKEARGGESSSEPDWPDGGLAAAAAVSAHFERAAEAADLLSRALAAAATPMQRLPILQLQAEEFLRIDRASEAVSPLEAVWAGRHDLPAEESMRAFNLLIPIYQAQLAFDLVVTRCREALDDLALSPSMKMRLTLARFEGMLALGKFAQVRSRTHGIAKQQLPPDEAATWQAFEARARLYLEEPLAARECAVRAVEATKALDGDSAEARTALLPVSAPAWEILGDAEAALFELKPALDAFEQARGLYARIRDSASADRLTLRIIALVLDDVGNLRETRSRLESAEHGLHNDGLVFLRARLELRCGRPERAMELIGHLLGKRPLPVRDRLRAYVAWSALGHECPPDFHSLLAAIPPATRVIVLSDALREWSGARITGPEIVQLLGEFKPVQLSDRGQAVTRTNQVTGVDEGKKSANDDGDDLKNDDVDDDGASGTSAASPPTGSAAPRPRRSTEDFAPMALRLAEALYFAGDDAGAVAQLKKATNAWSAVKNHAALRKCALAAYDIQGLSGRPGYPELETESMGRYPGFIAVEALGRARWSQRAGELDNAEMLCQMVIDLTTRMPLASRLRAQALERTSAVFRARGLTERAAEAESEAAKLYEDLDDSVAATRLHQRAQANIDADTAFIRVTVYHFGRRIDVESRLAKGAVLRMREGVGRRPLLDHIHPSTPGSIVPDAFIKRLVANWRDAALELTALLLEPEDLAALRELGAAPGWSLPLKITDLALSCLPWELLTQSRGWLSGVFDRSLRELFTVSPNPCMLHRASGRRGDAIALPPKERGVVIFAPSQVRITASSRSTGTARSDLEMLYYNAGLSCRLVEDPTFGGAQQILASVRPAILHLSATMKESPELSAPYLDFARDAQLEGATESATDSSTFTGSTVYQILASLPSGERPIVILDIARPPGLNDTVRQLLLRNSYAAELSAYAAAPAIIAGGLALPARAAEVSRALVARLAAGKSLGTVVQEMRDLAIPRDVEGFGSMLKRAGQVVGSFFNSASTQASKVAEFEDILGTVAVALFTEDPSMNLVTLQTL